jgi:hypothetical protein
MVDGMNRLYPWIALLASVASASAQSLNPESVARAAPGGSLPRSGVQVSALSPFPANCLSNQTGSVYQNSAVEPFVAVDPNRPEHLVGAWQQDRWSNGAATGVLAAVSMDRGRTWTTSFAHFSICTGGTYERASDPWVSIAPDGTVHQAALGVNGAGVLTSVLVSRSSDGGFTWSEPITVDVRPGDDKESITADPTDARYVYTIWDNTNGNSAPAWFSRSTDGGITWEPARIIYSPAVGGHANSHQIQVLQDGTLVDVFALTPPTVNGRSQLTSIAVMRSQDHGASWSAPAIVSTDGTIGTVDPKTQNDLRTGAGIPSASVDPVSGAVYIVWTDARFSGGLRDGVALSKSLDGGVTWSAPVQINQAPGVQAFTPTVAAGAGRVAVTYYDFRQDTNDPNVLMTTCWRVVSVNGGSSWTETQVAGPFDLLSAPLAGGAPFIGDYQGMAASGELFVAFYVAANSGNAMNPANVFASSLERAGDTRGNGRTEINLHPHPMRVGEKLPPEQARSKNLKQ